jgi:chemotaxis protein histidine kinase CheA
MDDVTRAFVAEARVNLGVLQNGLAISLSAPSPAAVGADALSAARSIRRAAALLNLPAVETAAGSIENLLASVSAPGRFLQHPDLQLLSRAAAALGEMLDQIELVGAQGIVDQSQLFAALRAVQPVLVGAPHPNASSTAPAGGESRTRPEPVFGGAPPVRAAGRTPDLSLYDVAALMVQLEGHDREGAGRLAEALRRIGGQALLPQEVLPSLSAAIEALDEVARGTAAEPDDRLAEAGRLIEEVTNALEDSGYPETAASAADPADSEATYLPPDADRELLGEFVTESRECINDAEAALLSLEVDPDNVEAVNTVFRAFHTIKGTSGFLSLPRVSELAHHAESLLSRMRNREIRCEGGYADLALRSVDMVKGLIEQVHGALGGKAMAAPPGYDRLLCLLVKAEAEPAAETVEAAEEPIDGHLRIGDILVAADKVDREQIDAVAASKGSEPLGIALVKSKAVSLTDVAKALRVQQRMAAGERIQESSVRVRTERLDRLIDMVGNW